MRSGDWGNLFILANSGLFLASVILQNAGVVDLHSASFVVGRAPRAHDVHRAEERRERERVGPRREWKRVGP